MSKKITRKQKIQKTKQELCWKCGYKIIKEHKTLECTNCGMKIIIT